MKQIQRSLFFFSFPLCSIASLVAVTPANAQQVIPDNTLGSESSIVNTNVDVKGSLGDRIDGGATRGTSLFHSFEKFNVDPNGRIYFNPQSGIQNIFSRVTGTNQSNIQGTLGVLSSNANLFFINPNGIVFGLNARLDVGGSFFASTAESLLFDGFEFSATNPQALPPTLNINIPIGLRFRDNPSSIEVRGSGQNLGQKNGAEASFKNTDLNNVPPGQTDLALLQVPAGKTLAFVGGNVTLDGGVLQAPGGQVQLGGLAKQGTVELKDNTLIFPEGVQRADVTLTNQAGINVMVNDNRSGGSITINGQNIRISTGSLLTAGIAKDLQTDNATAGDIRLNAIESVSVTDNSKIDNRTYGQGNAGNVIINAGENVLFNRSRAASPADSTDAIGNSGDIRITTKTLTLTNNTNFYTASVAQGNAGNIILNASNRIQIDSGSQVNSSAAGNSPVKGKGGNIEITTTPGVFSLTNGSQLFADTNGKGNAGNVIINANEVNLVGPDSFIFNRVLANAEGKGGEIRINTNSFVAKNGATLFAAIFGKGDGANVIIDAKERVTFDGSVGFNAIFSPVQGGAEGNGGAIRINTKLLELTNGATFNTSVDQNGRGKGGNIEITAGVLSLINRGQLLADTSGTGNAGDVIIKAERVELVGANSGIYDRVQKGAVANGGEIRINTNSLVAKDGAALFADINGKGNGANVIIDAQEQVIFDGRVGDNSSGVLSVVQGGAEGNSGAISIKTKLLELTNRATLNASLAKNGQGKGGNIEIETGVFSLTNGGQLLTDTGGRGNAGDVTIKAEQVEFVGVNTGIFNRVQKDAVGNGGKVRIDTNSLAMRKGAQVFADISGEGAGASVFIDAKERATFDGREPVLVDGKPDFSSSGVLSVVQASAVGNGGEIRVNTKLLELTNGAALNTSSSGNGSAGDININASDRIFIQNTQDFSENNTTGIFSLTGGNNISNNPPEIQIKTRELSLVGNAQINASTTGQNLAGNVIIDTESLSLSRGAQILAGVKKDAQGTAGSITITSKTLTVENQGSRIVVSSQGAGKAGDITITTNSLTLSDRAFISAETQSTEGGNIRLNVRDVLRLRQRSGISTSAEGTQSGGSGGNINIDVPLIVAFPENNDITANAVSGRGGNVRITVKGLFGIAPLSRTELAQRLNKTESDILNPAELPTSDITAISQQQPRLDGRVQLNTPDIDPNRGLVELPEDVTDPTQQVAQNPCQRGVGSTFVVTGRSGLPPSPTQSLSSHNARVGLLEPVASTATSATPSQLTSPSTTSIVQQLIPAQGWVRNEKGKVVLTAYDHTSTGSQRSLRTATSCVAR
ncbi:filamentous hemagglutinin N-terminal domain-containing protein [Scytonema sp. UIC 10036]|uniref:two-partner secretion domain-containing protein n=1 Tax=Scytonema sp. UIC 10036 TaxID=2304196 RepID=UPI0012DA4ED2|nr:filamentous hemagglutinin N-terminal domain-containing protein [Scytonema sp. UIC 10036]MUG92412.1 filamentous hemagglutinin N-terminal domain-containing protein [Scytonema sp. UIC 10036]